MIDIVKNILAPPHCICCDAPVAIKEKRHICYICGHKLPVIGENSCKLCGITLDTGYQDTICLPCKKKKFSFIRNVAAFEYQAGIRDSILRMKFGSMNIWIAKELGICLAEAIGEKYGDIAFDGVAYVPLSRKHFMKRKFNQAEEIAVFVSKERNIPIITDALIKQRETATQSSLKMKERGENVKNAFFVPNPEAVRDKILLLVDDIFTTGSTINECARTLKKAGALAIYSATVAITKNE